MSNNQQQQPPAVAALGGVDATALLLQQAGGGGAGGGGGNAESGASTIDRHLGGGAGSSSSTDQPTSNAPLNAAPSNGGGGGAIGGASVANAAAMNFYNATQNNGMMTIPEGLGSLPLSHEDTFTLMQQQFEKLQRNFATLSGYCQLEVARLHQERQALRHRQLLSEGKIRQLAESSRTIVKLNVGGTRFEAGEGTLRQFQGSFFDVMLDGSFPLERDDDGYIFIDRDPKLFGDVLQYLRTGELHPSFESASSNDATANWQKRQLIEEAKFYGLDLLATQLQARRRVWIVHSPASSSNTPAGSNAVSNSSAAGGPASRLVEGTLPSPRCFATCEYVGNGTLFMFGGCTANDAFFDTLFEIKILPNTTAAGGNPAGQMNLLGSEGDGGALAGGGLAAGGAAQGFITSTQRNTTDDEENLERFLFKKITPTPGGEQPAARSGHAMVCVGNHLVLVFGNNGSAMIEDIVVLDVAAAASGNYAWKKLVQQGANIQSRSGHTVCVVDNNIYVIGGKQIFPSMVTFGDIHVGKIDFDQLTIEWTELVPSGDAVQKRAYHVACSYKKRIFVYGGIVNDVYCRDLCIYDTEKNTWHVLKEGEPPKYVPSVARSGHVAIAHQNQMIVFGSYSEEGNNMLLHTFNFDTLHWSRISAIGRPPGKRAAPSAALLPLDTVFNKLPRLFLFGGFDIAARKCFDDVFTFTL